ncbi:MAG: long-chain fatty acid--CoA ligase [Sphingomonadales bacterium]|nr:long-chain fatty acid--CoA ligase [Sphingomonadales bacterium]
MQHQLNDSGARLLCVAPASADLAAEAAAGTKVTEILLMDDAAMAAFGGAPVTAQVPVDLVNGIAVLPYSSGTTGLPKGVMLSHGNLAWTARLLADINAPAGHHAPATANLAPGIGGGENDVGLSYLPLSHIAEQMALAIGDPVRRMIGQYLRVTSPTRRSSSGSATIRSPCLLSGGQCGASASGFARARTAPCPKAGSC